MSPDSTATVDNPVVADDALRAAPFHLDEAAIAWVRQTFKGMNFDDRLRQLFCEASTSDDPVEVDTLSKARLGGVTRFVGPDLHRAWQATRRLVECSQVPLLIAGDLEGGGIGMPCATQVPNQLGIAATDSVAVCEEIAGLMAREARALGFNWAFGPVLDINARHRSAIVSTRSFGDDPRRVLAMGLTSMRGLQREGIAATLKHWPGEGFDDRDQHLLTTINPLGMADWEARFGQPYRTLIDAGALCVMSAHIALPDWARQCGAEGVEAYRPASISRALNQTLLRERLGFNGLVVSDATMMAGLGSWGPRREVLPEVLESGCDMVLFSFAIDADIDLLKRAVDDGRLSVARIEAAVTRVLALKASLGLHRQSVDERIPPIETTRRIVGSGDHVAAAERAARNSVTLVKDVQRLLPLSPRQHRRVVVLTDDDRGGFVNQQSPVPLELPALLEARGFEVRRYDPERPPSPADTDLVVYLLAQESLYAQQTIQLDWRRIMGSREAAMLRVWHDIPTLLVSFGHPFYLFDAPRMPCVVNAYSPLPAVQAAVVACLLGDQPFLGKSPVDATCGVPDAVY